MAEVVIDSTPPVTPALTLDAGSVTGGIPNNTQDNNSNKYPAPTFDVTNVEPNATVSLYRNGVLVNTLVQGSTTGPATVMITDTNAGNGTIANGTYTYTVIQSDLAGNPARSPRRAPWSSPSRPTCRRRRSA